GFGGGRTGLRQRRAKLAPQGRTDDPRTRRRFDSVARRSGKRKSPSMLEGLFVWRARKGERGLCGCTAPARANARALPREGRAPQGDRRPVNNTEVRLCGAGLAKKGKVPRCLEGLFVWRARKGERGLWGCTAPA